MPTKKVVDKDYDIVNTTFSEIMVILVFITLVFIGVGQLESFRLNEDLNRTQEKLDLTQKDLEEISRALAALNVMRPDLDAPLISRLVNLRTAMAETGIDILGLDSDDISELARIIALAQEEEVTEEELEFILSQIRERGLADFEALIAQLDLMQTQVEALRGRLIATGNGVGVCWSDSGTSASEFLFDVIAYNESFFLVPAWESQRDVEVRSMPGIAEFLEQCEAGCELDDEAFINLGSGLREHSREIAAVGGIPCYLPVRYFEYADRDTGDRLILSQSYFGTAIRLRNRDYLLWRQENNLEQITIPQ
jgi:hypothetical protein